MLQVRQDVLGERFQLQRAAFEKQPFPDLGVRKDRLKRLLALTERHEAEICAAINADFGGRSTHETRLAELFVVRAGIRHTLSHLKGWMRERRVATTLPFLPGRNRLVPQPLGVVGIVSPWNYPFQLAVAPVTAALAAGNRVMVKPSELTPAFSALLAQTRRRAFRPGRAAASSPAMPRSARPSCRCRSIICCSPARPRSAARSRWPRPPT